MRTVATLVLAAFFQWYTRNLHGPPVFLLHRRQQRASATTTNKTRAGAMAELNVVLPTVGVGPADSRDSSPSHPRQLGSRPRMVHRQSSGLRTSARPRKAAKSKWRRAVRLAKLNAYVDNEDAFVKEGQKQLAEAADGVVTEVRGSQAEVVPLWQQGDMSMYSSFKLGTRAKLRTNPLIVSAIDAWWEVALASLQAQGMLGAEVTATDRLQAVSQSFVTTTLLPTEPMIHTHTH